MCLSIAKSSHYMPYLCSDINVNKLDLKYIQIYFFIETSGNCNPLHFEELVLRKQPI